MNEIELIRGFRARAAEPDADEAQRAKGELMKAIEKERGGKRLPLRPGFGLAPRRALVVALVVAALPAGYAIAEGVGSSGEVQDENGVAVGTDPSDCPEAAARFERAGVPSPTVYADGCPSTREVEEMLPSLKRDTERMRQLNPGWVPEG